MNFGSVGSTMYSAPSGCRWFGQSDWPAGGTEGGTEAPSDGCVENRDSTASANTQGRLAVSTHSTPTLSGRTEGNGY